MQKKRRPGTYQKGLRDRASFARATLLATDKTRLFTLSLGGGRSRFVCKRARNYGCLCYHRKCRGGEDSKQQACMERKYGLEEAHAISLYRYIVLGAGR